MSLEDLPLRFQSAECDANVVDIECQPFGEMGGGDRTEALHPAAHGGEGVVYGIPALGGDPEFAMSAVDGKHAAGFAQFGKPMLPFGNRWPRDEGEQRVVDFIG